MLIEEITVLNFSILTELKSGKIELSQQFNFDLSHDWILTIDLSTVPTTYILTHGKKSMCFNYEVICKLCRREYDVRLVRGRRQLVIPSQVLQSFVDNSVFIQWYGSTENQSQ